MPSSAERCDQCRFDENSTQHLAPPEPLPATRRGMHQADPAARARQLHPLRVRSSPTGLPLNGGPPRQRPSACRYWRGTSIAPGPTSATSKPEGVIQRQGDGFPLTEPHCLPAILAARAAAIAAQ